jgi:transcription initiation factor TFIID subunit 2
VAAAPVEGSAAEYSILKQRVDLDIDFANRSLKGSTEITVQPLAKSLKQIRLHCRQCKPTSIQVGGITAKWEYDDPYRRLRMPDQSDVKQHDMLKARIERSLRPEPHPELLVTLPPKLKIQELQAEPGALLPQANATPTVQKQESDIVGVLETPTVASAAQQGPQFAPIKLFIEFEVAVFRDGIHWIGHAEGDMRFPCMYTKAEPWAGNSSSIFPCVDDATSRCSWEVSIRCARTLGDAFRRPLAPLHESNGDIEAPEQDVEMVNGTATASKAVPSIEKPDQDYQISLSDEEAAMDLTVVCVGDLVDDAVDAEDETYHTVSFSLMQPVAARHIGFAIAPFEHVDLSAARDTEEEERLGQSAFKIDGYCPPGKSKELLNTCYPIAWAMDHMGVKYGSFPFGSYQVVFVDDFIYDTVPTAGLSFCSTHLLFPKTIIEPLYRNTRTLVQALADQWIGVNVIAKESTDAWVVAGVSGFMTDAYMRELCGNNEFRWQQKLAAEKVYELDVDRPSIRQLGELLHLDSSIRNFVNVKSALVLFILDRRLMKVSGNTGVQRIINKIFLNAKTGALVNGEVSTNEFQRTCERLGHNKLELFFRQWVFQSGVPIFYVTQRFNKKKLVVEMMIVQKQLERVTKPAFEPSNFMREVKEHVQEVWAPETNPVFTGPMTIRIHEADGTPYEHIVEIKEATTRLEIPYNTKYKRLKRSRRQRERQQAADAAEGEGEGAALHYCLGDKLDSEEEKREWNLADWSEEDEEKMGQESYEWIRMDADFEWIGKIHLVMPLYMYISQLQQDRDIVAQYESMRYLLGSNPHHVSLTILVRTLTDARYFWGIREMAADGLAILAKDKWRDIGQFHLVKAFRHLFCVDGTNMPKSNHFADRRNFILQCAIPRAMAKLRDGDGKVPMSVRQFFVDLLKFNDNSNNTIGDEELGTALLYSDNHYVATLIKCLADSLIVSHGEPQPSYTFSFGDEDPMDTVDDLDADFEKLAIAQIERHRRIDEWDPSYQNLYSVTALECLQRLTIAGIVKDKTAEVMKYVRSGNADNVRLAAWRCLGEVGVLRKMPAMKCLLYDLRRDQSPKFRDRLLAILGEALGHIALGDAEPAKVELPPPAEAGLVLEQEVSSEARRLEATRKTTPEGALVALKGVLEKDAEFAEALWSAITSRNLMLDEVCALCDIAALVYDAQDSHKLILSLPRKWRCENMGHGKVKFIPHGPYRTVPRKELSLRDFENLQRNGLIYNGPMSAEALKAQALQKKLEIDEASVLKLQIEEAQRQLQQAQQVGQIAAPEMPPPSAIVANPSTEKPSFKLNLAAKRKQSVDLTQRAGSPKAQKVSRQQSPADTIQTTLRRKASPAQSQRRSLTPGTKSALGKSKGSLPVVLRLGNSAARAQEIVSALPQPARATPTGEQSTLHASAQQPKSTSPALPQQQSSFPTVFAQSPDRTMNLFPGSTFAASPLQTMNLGGFRSYGPAPDADTKASVEVEPMDDEPTLATTDPAPVSENGDAGPITLDDVKEDAPVEEVKQDMPPPPRPKLTLKLGARKVSSQGSPD